MDVLALLYFTFSHIAELITLFCTMSCVFVIVTVSITWRSAWFHRSWRSIIRFCIKDDQNISFLCVKFGEFLFLSRARFPRHVWSLFRRSISVLLARRICNIPSGISPRGIMTIIITSLIAIEDDRHGDYMLPIIFYKVMQYSTSWNASCSERGFFSKNSSMSVTRRCLSMHAAR